MIDNQNILWVDGASMHRNHLGDVVIDLTQTVDSKTEPTIIFRIGMSESFAKTLAAHLQDKEEIHEEN